MYVASNQPVPRPAKAAGTEPANAAQAKATATPIDGMSKELPSLVGISPATTLKVEALDETARHHDYWGGEWWLVYATLGLVVVTLGLAIYTAKLYRATVSLGRDAKEAAAHQRGEMERSLAIAGKSADVAERSLTELERAYVFVDLDELALKGLITTAGGNNSINAAERLLVNYKLINRGRTPALLKERYHAFAVTEIGEMPEAIDSATTSAERLPVGIDCSAEKPAKLAIAVNRIADDDFRAAVIGKRKSLFLIGFVRYHDIFKKIHVIGFCAKLDLSTNRFMLEGDEAYNYTKDE